MTTWPLDVPAETGRGLGRRIELRPGAQESAVSRHLLSLSVVGDWAVRVYASRLLGHVDVHIAGQDRPVVVIAGVPTSGRDSLHGFGGGALAEAFHSRSAVFEDVVDFLLGMPRAWEPHADLAAAALAGGTPVSAVTEHLATRCAS